MDKNLQIAIKAPLAVERVIMDIYEAAFSVEFKGDNSSLFEAIMKVNAGINSYVLPTDIPTISEENTQTGYTIRKSEETFCIEDPFDGSK
jgi:3'(2'), 5'-bisphosphate nucleotidase